MRQTLLFSATMSEKIQTLTRHVQQSPEIISIGERRNPSESVKQHFYSIPQGNKVDLLLHVLKEEDMDSVIVFSRTKHGADRIMKRLSRSGFPSAAIHSNRSQSQRQAALAGFKSGKIKVLVATDIASRGIDVDGVSHVINFDTPPDAEDYIHRIGRTGRAGQTGDALSFVSRDELSSVRKIERHTGKRFHVKPYPGFVAAKIEESDEAEGNEEHDDSAFDNKHREGHQNSYHKKADVRRKNSSWKNKPGSRAAKQGFVVLSSTNEASGQGSNRQKSSATPRNGKFSGKREKNRGNEFRSKTAFVG